MVQSSLPGAKPANETKPSTSLKELLEASRSLPKRLNDVGTIHLGLNEIKRKAYELRKYNKTDKDVNPYTKAHYLLVGSGFTIEEIQSELDSIDLRQIDPSHVANVVDMGDIDSYMNSRKDENILTAIEQSLSAAARDFDTYVSKNITIDWAQRKKKLQNSLSTLLKRTEPSSELSSSPEKKAKTADANLEKQLIWNSTKHKHILSSKLEFTDVKVPESKASNPNLSYGLRQKFELYAQVIYELNDARQQGQSYPLATVFADLSKQEVSPKSKQLHETWLILRDFCETEEAKSGQILERRFAKGHCSDSLTEFESLSLRKRIVTRSRNYLEAQFLDYINELYLKSDVTAQDNKVASTVTKIQNFLELTLRGKNKEWKVPNLYFVNGNPIWATLFYLLRAGCLDEAVQLVTQSTDSFQKLERSFPMYLKSYCQSPDRKLSRELQGRILNEFNQYFKHFNKEIDPFKYAVYKLIGRCDLSKKNLPSITLSIEDWLWFHLSLIQEDEFDEDELVREFYTLNDFQKSVLQYGADSFNASANNPMYLQALVLTGLYEVAVKYLFEKSEIDAVHLAITLAYYGLLRVPDEKTEEDDKMLTVDSRGFDSISYARLLGYFTSSFKFSDPRVAAEYLFCICLCDGLKPSLKEAQITLGRNAIRELVLETREFVILLGKIDKDGTRSPGIIEQRKKLLYLDDKESYLHNIAEQAAVKADEEGRPFDCILLYQLSEEYDMVIDLVNRVLAEFLISIDLKTPIDDILDQELIQGETNIVKLAQRLMQIYSASPSILERVSLKQRETCSALLDMVEIRREFTTTNPDFAGILLKIETLNVIPCSATMELEKIRAKSQELKTISEDITKNVPNLLVIEMSCIAQLFYELSQGYDSNVLKLPQISAQNASKEDKLVSLRQMSRNCMIYAGMVQYKMPREVYTTLINLEVNM
ncbi:hypothetical protein KL929_001383 [Ogataea haglerorum]|nr:hypothetical protein KL929_001383 [Ogataea haglerorum]